MRNSNQVLDWVLLCVFTVTILFVVLANSISKKRKQLMQLQRYENISLNMPEYTMLDIMGG